jgi:TonB-dependent SusC/RagA subfamily outer membrane receptor
VVGRSAGKRADEVRIVTRKYAESQLDAQVADSVRGTLMQVAVDTSLLARMDSASRLGRMDSVRARVGVRDTTAIVSMALMRDSSAGNTIVRRSGERLPYTVQCSGDECNPSGDSVRTRMSGSRVILRADSSASASQAQPLFIIDGVISTRGLAHLNPDNIESIEVVKGNAAERFYGPRAANGVINITTKRP